MYARSLGSLPARRPHVVAVGNASTAASLRALLDSTQILINVHTTAHHHTLEEYRVLPALLRGCVVVSEDCSRRTGGSWRRRRASAASTGTDKRPHLPLTN